jgi:protein-tyrosine phosphatase
MGACRVANAVLARPVGPTTHGGGARLEPVLTDLSWITPQLAVGAAVERDQLRELRAQGITHVVDVRIEDTHDQAVLQQEGLALLQLPTEDCCAVSQQMLDEAVTWVNPPLDAGRCVLVHCQHGIGRSALVALCVLASRGLGPVEAMLRAKNAREKISPSPAQLAAFLEWCRRQGRASPGHPGVDDLGRIAWRHLQGQGGTGTLGG